jgi:hypothetical protein
VDTWSESGTRAPAGRAPTALGHGDPAWAAYYDNVVNRLAFYDALEDGATGPLAYLVCGWYADVAADPLGDPAIASLTEFEAHLSDLGWSLPTGAIEVDIPGFAVPAQSALTAAAAAIAPSIVPVMTDGTWWPRSCLFHGSVVGIGWPDQDLPAAEQGVLGGFTGGAPAAADVQVAFGATSTDALAALLATPTAKPAATRVAPAPGSSLPDLPARRQEMLEALHEGALSEIDHPDGRARLDGRLHAAGFDARPSGTTTERVPIPGSLDPVVMPASTSTPAAPRAMGPAHPGAALADGLSSVTHGGLESILPRPAAAAAAPTGEEDVQRSLARFYRAAEPTVAVQGGRRSTKHGGDGRFMQDGTLMCRLSGQTVTALQVRMSDTASGSIQPAQLLARRLTRAGLPVECDDLLAEIVLLDPGSARPAAQLVLPPVASNDPGIDELAGTFLVEQTVWWVLRDPSVDASAIERYSGLHGTLPSPLAVTPPSSPWTPRHLDWEVEVFRSPRGLDDWTLGELDFDLDDPAGAPATPGTGTTIRARSLLTGKVAETAAAAGREAIRVAQLAGGEAAATVANAQDVIDILQSMDVLTGTLGQIHATLRGEAEGQYVGGTPATPAPRPDAIGLVAGLLRPVRMRLVDGFGQVVDLLDSSATAPADAKGAAKSPSVAVSGRGDVVALPPRFTAPSRLLLRFTDADPSPLAKPPALELVGADVRPVCGFVLPDHLDGALEVFDAAGANLGSLRTTDDGAIVWEDAPGLPSRLGARPSEVIPNRFLGAMADALVARGALDASNPDDEGALEALLRMVDATLWTVDPFGHAGDEHLSLLVGHPLAVLRATLRLDVDDPLQPSDTARASVPVRLGALSQWQDGLMAFFVGDDYTLVRPADPAAPMLAREVGPGQGYLGPIGSVPGYHTSFADDVAPGTTPKTPVTHPYAADSAVFAIRAGEEVAVTMLAMPQTYVHATTGLLPRKEVGMRREWIAPGLARIAPTFRFGPVLVDPRTIRMPVPTELSGSWSWDHRSDAATWARDPVVNATADALLGTPPAIAEEGWLELDPPEQT